MPAIIPATPFGGHLESKRQPLRTLASVLEKRQYWGGYGYGSGGWYSWGRWLFLGLVIFFFLLALFSVRMLSRRRLRQGHRALPGTAWMLPTYQQSQQQYHNQAPPQNYNGNAAAGNYYQPPPMQQQSQSYAYPPGQQGGAPSYSGQHPTQPPQAAYRNSEQYDLPPYPGNKLDEQASGSTTQVPAPPAAAAHKG